MFLESAGTVLVYLLVLFVPGALVGVAAGLRRHVVLASAPLVTYGLASVAATVATVVHYHWGPVALLVETVVVAGLVALVRLAARRRTGAPAAPWWPGWRLSRGDVALLLGVAAGGLLSAGVMLRGMGGLDRPNQDWDSSFHANAVRFVADSGNLDPAALRVINDWETPNFFYPNTYHAIAAVVRDLTGADVFAVVNAQILLLVGLAGLGLAVLLRQVGAPRLVQVVTPVLLAGFTSFPYDVVWRGPLLPYATGLALTPGLLVLLRAVLDTRRPLHAVTLALAAASLVGLQPSTAISAVFFGVPFLLQRWWEARRVPLREVLVLVGTGVLTLLLVAPSLLGAVRTGTAGGAVDWPAVESAGQATGDLFLLNHAAPAPEYWLAALMIVGLLTLRSARPMWWWLAGTAVAAGLFVAAASMDTPLVETATRAWWNDRWRFAAIAVLGFAPLAGHGFAQVAGALSRVVAAGVTRVRRSGGMRPARWLPATVAVLLLAALFGVSGGLYADRNSDRVSWSYAGGYLSDTEIQAMSWLHDHVDNGAMVMNDPTDGSPFMWATAGVRPVFGHLISIQVYPVLGPTQRLLLQHFDCLDTRDDVRAAIRSMDIEYVFVSGGRFANTTPAEGLDEVAESPSLQLAYDQGGVRIYRVDLGAAPAATPLPGCEAPAT